MDTVSQGPEAKPRLGFWTGWLLLALLVAALLAIVAIPVFSIMPFKPQTASDLSVAYTLRRWSPWTTLAGLAVAIALAVRIWRASRRWWSKTALVLAFAPLLLAVWFARQNHFEWMFRPLPGAGYVRASQADFVADDDMVLAVSTNGDAAAYPVRQIAYHHVVQDTVGGVPVVVTY